MNALKVLTLAACMKTVPACTNHSSFVSGYMYMYMYIHDNFEMNLQRSIKNTCYEDLCVRCTCM